MVCKPDPMMFARHWSFARKLIACLFPTRLSFLPQKTPLFTTLAGPDHSLAPRPSRMRRFFMRWPDPEIDQKLQGSHQRSEEWRRAGSCNLLRVAELPVRKMAPAE